MIAPCGTVNDSIWPTYSWWAADNADWYLVYVRNLPGNTIHPFGAGGQWVQASAVCDGDICQYRPVDGLANTSPNHFGLANNSYEWSMQSYDSTTGTFSGWQPNQAFDVVNPVPTIIDPLQNTLDGFPTYTWTPVPDADQYQLWAGGQDNTALIDIWLSAADVCDADLCRYQSRESTDYLFANQHNGLYAWYVRAYHSRAAVTGAWQGTNFDITALTPGTPTVQSATPVVNAAGRQGLTLTWQKGTFAEFYYVRIRDANQTAIYNWGWVYQQNICVDGLCSLTLFFDGAGRDVLLAAMNASSVVTWGSAHPFTVFEPSEQMVLSQPSTSAVATDSLDADSTPETDTFGPPTDLEPPHVIELYPDICTVDPLCDGPPTD
jgi:hypothetical protein